MPLIRRFEDADWPALWPLLQSTFAAGDTYAYPPDMSEADARRAWVDAPQRTCVALSDAGVLLGSYVLKPNQPGLGSHVCNCGYLVAPAARGRGIARTLCEHSQALAVELGYRAMQFNLVVATNEVALRLWQRLGFEIVGTLPGAFLHRALGPVDAFVMFKDLQPPADAAARRGPESLLPAYAAAVRARDVDAFMAIYAPEVRVFDAWGVWSCEGAAVWRGVVETWFGAHPDEVLSVRFDDLRVAASGAWASLSASVTYAASSAAGEPLRSMDNRLSWVLRRSAAGWQVVHEHTSAPAGFEDGKAILQRAAAPGPAAA